MRIHLNGEPCHSEVENLAELLVEHAYRDDSVATAVNGSFVQRHERGETSLQEGDRVEVVAAIEGG